MHRSTLVDYRIVELPKKRRESFSARMNLNYCSPLRISTIRLMNPGTTGRFLTFLVI